MSRLDPYTLIWPLLEHSASRSDIEFGLGLEKDSLDGGDLIRVDVPDALDRALRLPDPKTGNIHHRPGAGLTSGNLNEGVVDSPMKADKAIKESRPKIRNKD